MLSTSKTSVSNGENGIRGIMSRTTEEVEVEVNIMRVMLNSHISPLHRKACIQDDLFLVT